MDSDAGFAGALAYLATSLCISTILWYNYRNGVLPYVALYACHPISIASCVRSSTELYADALISGIAASSAFGSSLLILANVVVLVLLSPLQGIAILVPTIVLSIKPPGGRAKQGRTAFDTAIGLALAAMPCAIAYYTIDWRWPTLLAHFRSMLSPAPVAAASSWPELGVSWYLFSEAFLRYMPYFTWTVWLHPFLYTMPLVLRFWDRPDVALVAQMALTAMFDPSPGYSLTRLPLAMALMATCGGGDVAREMKGVFLPLALAHFSVFVSPAMKALWLHTPLGNANFLFNHTMILALSAGACVTEFVVAAMRLKRKAKAGATAAVGSGSEAGAGLDQPAVVRPDPAGVTDDGRKPNQFDSPARNGKNSVAHGTSPGQGLMRRLQQSAVTSARAPCTRGAGSSGHTVPGPHGGSLDSHRYQYHSGGGF